MNGPHLPLVGQRRHLQWSACSRWLLTFLGTRYVSDPPIMSCAHVVDAQDGSLMYMWQGRIARLEQLQPSQKFLQPAAQAVVEILDRDQASARLDKDGAAGSNTGQSERYLISGKLPLGPGAALSPCGCLIVDIADVDDPSASLIRGSNPDLAQDKKLVHYCIASATLHDVPGISPKQSPPSGIAWLPHSKGRPMYALCDDSNRIAIVDAHAHCVLIQWSWVDLGSAVAPAHFQCEGRYSNIRRQVEWLTWSPCSRHLALTNPYHGGHAVICSF